jgi:protein-disulfide isomerase
VNQNRVIAIAAAVLAAAALGYFGYRTFSSDSAVIQQAANERPQGAFEKELMVPGPLGDMSMGDRNAPLTVIEYASLTCSHCADFEKETFPSFKKDYIDTGKAYYILRDFPFDPVATAAFMLSHCAGPERYFGFIEVLYQQQAQWAFVDTPMEALKKIARQGGFSDEKFDACMKDQQVFDHVKQVAQKGQEFGVRSTPTFFINGEKVEGALPYKEFEAALKKHLPGAEPDGATPSGEAAPAAPEQK